MATEAFTVNPKNLKSPTNSVSVITGGSSGIGLQTAILLHQICPNNRIAVLDRNPPVSSAPKDLTSSDRFLFLQCDLVSWTAQRDAFQKTTDKFGAIDNVFVNAGIAEYGDQFFKDETDSEGKLKEPDRRVYTIDLNAANDTVKLALYHMRHRKDGRRGGSIVMTASLAGYLASAGAPQYSAAKHGKNKAEYGRSLNTDTDRNRWPYASPQERLRNPRHCDQCCSTWHYAHGDYIR